MNYRRTWAVARKEFRHILRDPRSLTMALAMPLLMLVLFGFALSLDVDRVSTFIYDADHTSASRDLIRQFQGSRYFEVEGFVDNYHAIEKAIDSGKILMAVAIERGYGEHVRAGEQADVQILIDGSDSNTAAIALGYADSLISSYAFRVRSQAMARKAGLTLALPVDARLRVWYNSSLESKNYVVPGLIAVILMIIAALLTSLTIAREWEMGTMEQVLSTPLRPAEMVIGKMLAFFAVGFADMLISIATGLIVFHVPFRGSFLLLIAVSSIFLFGSLFWGIFLSAATKSQLMAYQLGILSSFLPAFLLSGFVYAIETMPPVIRAITTLVPARYFVTILKGIFLKGVGIQVLWLDIGFLAIYALIVFWLAKRQLNGKLA
ncbi:MAG TPA: ABC transporter permease [Bryobacteraceae bacterium]|nr:ABC transporter permease [Bryobacteraceae bacterium]